MTDLRTKVNSDVVEPVHEAPMPSQDHSSASGRPTSVLATQDSDPGVPSSEKSFSPGWRVYAIVGGLGIANILAALENTVLTVAAPVILTDLGVGDDYIWTTNAFFLCSTVIQPLFGQLFNIFGRRYVILAVVAIFMLGSAVCGGASTGGMLIAGRSIQGIGSGGIILGSSIVMSDLVPLRHRGNLSAILMAILGIGSALGPFIGGAIVDTTTWRWVFYLNLPIGGAAFILLFIFLRMNYNKEMTLSERLRRIDLVGNIILIASTVAVLYALSYAGTRHSWASWNTLVPMLLGSVGFFVFAWIQTTNISVEPLMPTRFFASYTPIVVSVNTFLFAALFYWYLFFLPVYFQSVKLYSSIQSGLGVLPLSLLGIPGSILGAISLTRWGKYKIAHIISFSLQTIGFGLLTLQDETTPIAEWVGFQCITSIGGGIVFTTLLPTFQAFVSERDVASCTAVWYFIRMFGHIWGVAIPAAIFNNRVDAVLRGGAISDPQVAAVMSAGGAYESASAKFVKQFPVESQNEIRAVYRMALQRVFQIGIVFSGVALILAVFEKEIELRNTLQTDFGLEEREKNRTQDEEIRDATK